MNDQQPPVESRKSSGSVGSNGSWALGLAIVFIGSLLLAKNLGIHLSIFDYDNWWAIFILLAAIGPLVRAIKCFARDGWTMDVANSLVTAVAIIAIGLIILFDLSIFTWWPVFLIIGGLYMMTNRSAK